MTAPRRRRWTRCLGCGVVLALSLAILVLVFLARLAPMGAAYQAKVLASGVFVSGRASEDVLAEDLDPAELSFLLRLCRSTVDEGSEQASATFAGVDAARVVWRRGLGTTIVVGELQDVPPPPVVGPPADPSAPWPQGEAVDVDLLPAARERRAALDALLDEAMTEPAGLPPRRTRGLVVVWRGRIVGERYAPGFTPDMPQLGWSMTKTVTAALVGALIREGRLELERPLPVPEWQTPDDPRAAITLEQLLHMQSGLAFREDYSPLTDVTTMLFCERDAGGFAAAKPLAHPPGTHWSYSSGTTNVICRALRQVLGDAAYYRLPYEALFEPLGMRSALIELDSAGHFVGSSLGWATPRDWARFGLLWVQDGVWDGQRILPEGWVQWCTQAAEHSNGRYGGHLWLKLEDDGSGAELPPDTIHAAGHDRQLVTMIPSEELVVVRLGLTRNRVSWDQEQFVADLLEVLRRP